jgi:hypothetical protein
MFDLPEGTNEGLGDPRLRKRLARDPQADEEDERAAFWRGVLIAYFHARHESTQRLTQAQFAKAHGLSLRAFRFQLAMHGEAIKKDLGLLVPQSAPRSRVMLTARDEAIMQRLGHDRCHSLAFLAKQYFGDAQSPADAATKRLRLLERAGYLRLGRSLHPLISLTPRGARRVGAAPPRPVHPRHLAHHLATLRAIETYRQQVEAEGGRFVSTALPTGGTAEYQLEFHIQAAERGGQGTVAGRNYDVSPDAIVFVELPDPATGEMKAATVALEYYTASYSDTQIRGKAVLVSQYDAICQVADSAATARRVAGLTGAPCSIQGKAE